MVFDLCSNTTGPPQALNGLNFLACGGAVVFDHSFACGGQIPQVHQRHDSEQKHEIS